MRERDAAKQTDRPRKKDMWRDGAAEGRAAGNICLFWSLFSLSLSLTASCNEIGTLTWAWLCIWAWYAHLTDICAAYCAASKKYFESRAPDVPISFHDAVLPFLLMHSPLPLTLRCLFSFRNIYMPVYCLVYQSHNCAEDGPPGEGEVVSVMWTDGKEYGGKFIRTRTQLEYQVLLTGQPFLVVFSTFLWSHGACKLLANGLISLKT